MSDLHKDKQACVKVSLGTGADLGFDKYAHTPCVEIRSDRSTDLGFDKDANIPCVDVSGQAGCMTE